jgi:hypothetical protein
MCANLLKSLDSNDTLTINDVNSKTAQKFAAESTRTVEVGESPAEVAARSVRQRYPIMRALFSTLSNDANHIFLFQFF